MPWSAGGGGGGGLAAPPRGAGRCRGRRVVSRLGRLACGAGSAGAMWRSRALAARQVGVAGGVRCVIVMMLRMYCMNECMCLHRMSINDVYIKKKKGKREFWIFTIMVISECN